MPPGTIFLTPRNRHTGMCGRVRHGVVMGAGNRAMGVGGEKVPSKKTPSGSGRLPPSTMLLVPVKRHDGKTL